MNETAFDTDRFSAADKDYTDAENLSELFERESLRYSRKFTEEGKAVSI